MTREFRLDELHIYEDRPDDKEKCPAVILLHGLTGYSWEKHLETAAGMLKENGYAVYRPSLYGHGKSVKKFEDHTVSLWVEEILRVINYVQGLSDVDSLYLAGHSQGGLAAAVAAGRNAAALKGLILLAPAFNLPPDAREGRFLGVRAFDPKRIPKILVLGEHKLKDCWIRDIMEIDTHQVMESYHSPVRIVHGDQDLAVPLEYSKDALMHYPCAGLEVIAGADHEFTLYAEQMARSMIEFLKEQEG